MIKNLLFMAALLFPSAVYAGNPSASFTDQVVPVGSNPIACDIGPSYKGSIPAGAQAAGFTHCAANYDFAQTAPFTDSAGTHVWSNLQSWLTSGNNSTCVSGTPLMWIINYGANFYAPCNDFTTVDDTAHGGASQVLKAAYKVGDIHAVTHFGTASNFGLPNPPGTYLPAGYYAEEMFRLDSTYTNNTPCPPNGTQACLYFDFWTYPESVSQNLEFDFVEAYAQQGPPNNSAPHAGGGQQYGGGFQDWTNPGPLTASQLEQYNTFGALVTVTNGGSPNYSGCYYLNGTKYNCTAITASAGDITNGRQNIFNTIGPQYQPGGSPGCNPCVTVQQDNIVYIQRLTIWTCGNGGGPCYSAGLVQ